MARWTLTVLLAFASLASLSSRAFADVIYADLDHDGVRDIVTIQPLPVTGLRVWLSSANVSFELPTRRPIMRVTTWDIDGDGHLDLVASDTSAGVHVWHRTTRGHLRRIRPRRTPPPDGLTRNGRVNNAPDETSAALGDETSSAPPFDVLHPENLPALDVAFPAVEARTPLATSAGARLHDPRGPPVAP